MGNKHINYFFIYLYLCFQKEFYFDIIIIIFKFPCHQAYTSEWPRIKTSGHTSSQYTLILAAVDRSKRVQS